MDKTIIELLGEVSGADLLIALIFIASLGVLVLTQKDRVLKHLNKWRDNKNEEEDFQSLVYDLKDSIEKLSIEVKNNQDNRDKELLEYHTKSDKVHDSLFEMAEYNRKSIDELKDIVLNIEKKNSETKRAEIKERIERIYRECNCEKICTEMQFETLKDLIEQYEKNGGTNSFVHSTVQPEMYTWKIVSEIRRVNR